MRKILAIIEGNEKTGYSVYTPDTTSAALNGQGKTVAEAIEDLKEATEEIKEYCMEEDGKLPEELEGDFEFEYKYDVPSLFSFFNEINITAFAKRIGLNASLLRQYKSGLAFASEKQVKKIEKGLHELGRQLCAAKL